MKILLVNKFLYPKGGAETYTFALGEILKKNGYSVEFFGLKNEKNIVGNSAEAYVEDMDFSAGILKNLLSPFRMIYSVDACRKLRKVLNDFSPDVIHLNNIHYHLTPSIIIEANRYRKKTGRNLKIVYTVHDYQLICPSHGLFDSQIRVCEKCLDGNYTHCLRTRCVKKSFLKSFIATVDAYVWKKSKAYDYIDSIICPSRFLKGKLDTQDRFREKTVAIHNFIEPKSVLETEKENYVLEFGHLSRDKGTNTLLEAAKNMPETRFVFAGYGVAVQDIEKVENAEYVGFKTGDELKSLIAKAKCSVCPSEWYENCPYTVIESQMYLTPVIGSRMGGIPEIIEEGKTGLLFEAGNAKDLEEKLRYLLYDEERLNEYINNCKEIMFETPDTYYEKLMNIYGDAK